MAGDVPNLNISTEPAGSFCASFSVTSVTAVALSAISSGEAR